MQRSQGGNILQPAEQDVCETNMVTHRSSFSFRPSGGGSSLILKVL